MEEQSEVIFALTRPYQLMVADCYARYIFHKYGVKSTFIVFGFHHEKYCAEYARIVVGPYINGMNIIKRIWYRLFYEGWFSVLNPFYKRFKKNTNIVFFCFDDNHYIIKKAIKIVKRKESNIAVLVEEGIGVYANTTLKKEPFKYRIIRLLSKIALGIQLERRAIGDNKFIDCAIVDNVSQYKCLDKAQKQKVIQQSKNKIFAESELFLPRYIGLDKLGQELLQPCDVLYLGEPLLGFGNLGKEESKFIRHIIGLMPTKVNIIIKPHPAEPTEKYDSIVAEFKNAKLIDSMLKNVPIECLIGGVRPQVVISFFSSAGINIANAHSNIKVVFAYGMDSAAEVNSIMGTAYGIMNNNIFISRYNNISIPQSDDEFLETIKTIEDYNEPTTAHEISQTYQEIDAIWNIKNNKQLEETYA